MKSKSMLIGPKNSVFFASKVENAIYKKAKSLQSSKSTATKLLVPFQQKAST